ncbi:DUF2933 domain-containing protein [Moritella sp. F3]|uniref:DUF2933 domain-containing protein n=1 Tax=Moritella sp. F3 TaxID=2718882 RepID=UPI001A1A2786|nr:DUF2933 domain-containing protein [Moritella sp. F3]GIC75421.1 hypothetical protein FMO001_01480 [Moritella sp. F1]GIC80566.1 hypothetical protein FMO003_08470 [Moritella sp. F3]
MMKMNKLCKLMLVLCLGLPLAYFAFVGNMSFVAIGSSLLIPLVLCVVMMFFMMKMMGCDSKKEKDKDTQNKDIEYDKN